MLFRCAPPPIFLLAHSLLITKAVLDLLKRGRASGLRLLWQGKGQVRPPIARNFPFINCMTGKLFIHDKTSCLKRALTGTITREVLVDTVEFAQIIPQVHIPLNRYIRNSRHRKSVAAALRATEFKNEIRSDALSITKIFGKQLFPSLANEKRFMARSGIARRFERAARTEEIYKKFVHKLERCSLYIRKVSGTVFLILNIFDAFSKA